MAGKLKTLKLHMPFDPHPRGGDERGQLLCRELGAATLQGRLEAAQLPGEGPAKRVQAHLYNGR